ncbi:MAG: aspartate aminotransferase family protein, partial [Gammaproteobacteria bacterium]
TLSGNPLGMAAGLATLQVLDAPDFYEKLNSNTARLTEGLRSAANAAGIPFTINQVCGMFGLFFTDTLNISNYTQVTRCDVERFKRFFHGMLAEGVYFAPSAFEAGFLSSAHTAADLDATVTAAQKVFKSIANR